MSAAVRRVLLAAAARRRVRRVHRSTHRAQGQRTSTSRSPPNPLSLSLIGNTDLPSSQIASVISDGLVAYDAAGGYVPMVARAWELAPDGKTLTLRLTRRRPVARRPARDLARRRLHRSEDKGARDHVPGVGFGVRERRLRRDSGRSHRRRALHDDVRRRVGAMARAARPGARRVERREFSAGCVRAPSDRLRPVPVRQP